jgi:hypothetical protein
MMWTPERLERPVLRRRALSLADALSPYRVTRRPVPASERRAWRGIAWRRLQVKARIGR